MPRVYTEWTYNAETRGHSRSTIDKGVAFTEIEPHELPGHGRVYRWGVYTGIGGTECDSGWSRDIVAARSAAFKALKMATRAHYEALDAAAARYLSDEKAATADCVRLLCQNGIVWGPAGQR